MKFLRTKILGMPIIYALCVIFVLLIGILIGSFLDFDIDASIANNTNIGSFFATYGSYIPYCLYPIAGMCLFKALKKQGKSFTFLAWLLLIISYFLAVYYSNSYNGAKVRKLFGDFPDGAPFYVSFLSILLWIVLYSWVPIVFYFILDDANPRALLCVGITILLAGVISDNLNLWLKQLASRPRYKYLVTLPDPKASFRNWWEFAPYKAGNDDNFKSWPSGNMTIATMIFSLPLVVGNIKKSNKIAVIISFVFACAFVILYGYNRMHMSAHFLSDVCFGTLFTYLVFALIDYAFARTLKIE